MGIGAASAPDARAAGAGTAVKVVITDDETRLRRADGARLGEPGLPAEGGQVRLSALRGETVAFQVVLVAGDQPIDTARVSFSELVGGTVRPRVTVFRQHYLRVAQRSRNERRPLESLGWRAPARPPDAEVTGELPDALIPVELDANGKAPIPLVPAGQLGAFWIDVDVPDDTAAGAYRGEAEVVVGATRVARFTLSVTVHATRLPYRAASAFVFYEPRRLAQRIGDGEAVERQLWQLLHQHHVDALAPLTTAQDAERLQSVWDGSLFTVAGGYRGPGRGTPPAVVALGAYGTLGEPSPAAVKQVEELAARLPTGVGDVFLYAIDEQCSSQRAAAWKQALAGRAAVARVRVGQTCDDPPAQQAADVAMIPAGDFARSFVTAARAAGRRAWIYNGLLPHTGTLLLDADPRGLVANGWIAALAAIERWFYWESTFWDDGNRGGRGPVEPFSTAETFHNQDGDSALGDGLLLYPGRQQGPFAAASLGYAGVLPSLRLKALRRGIQDAGYLALAARENPDRAAQIAAKVLPTILDEASAQGPAAWADRTERFSHAREHLRTLITRTDEPSVGELRLAFEQLAGRRRTLPAAPHPPSRRVRAGFLATAALIVAATGAALVWRRRRRAPESIRSGELGR